MPNPAALRVALLDQLVYLIDEVEALKAVVDRIPEPLQEGRPPGETLSIKETYGLLAALDEAVHRPRLERIMAEEDPVFENVDEAALVGQEDWNALPMVAILERVQQARRRLAGLLRALPAEAWGRPFRLGAERLDVHALVHRVTQRDADLLRPVGYRLHDSGM